MGSAFILGKVKTGLLFCLLADQNHILNESGILTEKSREQSVSKGYFSDFLFSDDYVCLNRTQRSSHCHVILQFPTGSPKTEKQMQDYLEETCKNIDEEEEECLMRRTLAAHVDYIYTQGHNRP